MSDDIKPIGRMFLVVGGLAGIFASHMLVDPSMRETWYIPVLLFAPALIMTVSGYSVAIVVVDWIYRQERRRIEEERVNATISYPGLWDATLDGPEQG